MADNVEITAGSGTSVATDDCGAAGHTQIIKLAISTDGAATHIPADAANGLDVDVTRLPADPLGANADAASATGSISAKLRSIAATGIPVTAVPAPLNLVGNGAAATALRVTLANDSTGTTAVTNAGTFAVQAAGAVAHDTADAGNPVKVGARAAPLAASVTLVAVADRTDNVSDLDGALIVRNGCQLGDIISDVLANTNGNATAFGGSFAATANVRNYITAVAIANTSASAVTMDLRDGTGGAVLFTFMVPAGGGIVVPFNPPLRQPTVNTALAIDGSAAATTVTVSVNGFKSKA